MELLQSMQVFVRVAELASFTKAADATQLGRPQVTRAIQDLEASLGVRLFQRTTRQVRLTTEGEQFYERVMDILGRLAETTSMFNTAELAFEESCGLILRRRFPSLHSSQV